jgi:hypothetical protein
MRWTKLALSIFGAGLMLGLVVVAGEINALARMASLMMVFGIIALPVGALIDWRRAAKTARPPKQRGRQTSRGAASDRRRAVRARKPPSPKR